MALHTCDRNVCIAEAHLYEGTSLNNARDRRARRGYADNVRGVDQHLATLTETQVKQLRASTEPASYFAKLWKVNVSTINRARRRDTWRHVN